MSDRLQISHRNLPHWSKDGAIYFVTWRLRPDLQLDPEERSVVMGCIKHFHKQRYMVFVATVMPDHVHLLIHPLVRPDGTYWPLGKIIKGMKGVSARRINKRRGRLGALWLDERFDRIPRSEHEFEEKYIYVRGNPIKHGLCEHWQDYPWVWIGDIPHGLLRPEG